VLGRPLETSSRKTVTFSRKTEPENVNIFWLFLRSGYWTMENGIPWQAYVARWGSRNKPLQAEASGEIDAMQQLKDENKKTENARSDTPVRWG